MPRSQLSAGADLNTIETPGTYVLPPGCKNIPPSHTAWSLLLVFQLNSSNLGQILIGNASFCSRWKAGDPPAWVPWFSWFNQQRGSITPSSGITISAQNVRTYGGLTVFSFNASKSSAWAENTEVAIGTLTGVNLCLVRGTGIATSGLVYVDGSNIIRYRPTMALASTTTVYGQGIVFTNG